MEQSSAPLILEETPRYLDHDGLWKNVITELFKPFVRFFAPNLYQMIDWSVKADSLEQEFHRVFPEKKGKRYTDKLMKVHQKNGQERWMLIHIEVQGYEDKDFAERMFQYFYRIFDKYNRKIYAMAIFADDNEYFQPAQYTYQFYGTELNYTYNTYKIAQQDEETLLQSDNPFAYAILAGLYMIKSKNNASKRYQFKRRLFELLIRGQRVDNREYSGALLYFIDYLLEVPKEMAEKLQKEVKPIVQEEESHMFTTKYPDPPTLKPIFDEIREEGKVKAKKEVALNMLRKGYAVETVVELTGLTKEEVTALKSEW
ncbi:Rpn family recombination-promoting nuclease/putative transposase [Lentibacillus cibarius]|uniref:Rpn family recombination-promoting nuclease/putative transposase n=1 Tax=Lentibacillus cibarius TaxID=2583219 RepID=UPI00163D6DE7|nr:Rpn family recombination-promoting nuclease/putative transposase [Lentibacillus cibarius]